MTDLMTLLANNIKLGKYRKEDKIAQIDLLLVQDKITLEQYNELIDQIDQYADPDFQPPKTTETRVNDLEARVADQQESLIQQQQRQDITEQAVQDLIITMIGGE